MISLGIFRIFHGFCFTNEVLIAILPGLANYSEQSILIMTRAILLIFVICFFGLGAFAQTETNVEALIEFAEKKRIEFETFEKYQFLPAQLNLYLIFNRGLSSRKAIILTTPEK